MIVPIPLDVAKVWGTRGRLRVKGEINDYAFRSSLFPSGDGKHFLLVNKRMQAGGKATAGTSARFRLEPDTQERSITAPAELEKALSEDRSLRWWFDRLTYSTRKYLTDRIREPKSAEARVRRADQVAELLLSTKEAERETPPILEAVFARDPRAREGWKRMSASQRRMHLLGIFTYRSPEARARRVAKMVQDAHRFSVREQKKR